MTVSYTLAGGLLFPVKSPPLMADSSSSGLASTQAALLLEKPRLTVHAVWTISDFPSGYGQVGCG